MADGHKFSVIRRLCRRLFDRSKNAIFTHPTCIWRPCWEWPRWNFVEIFFASVNYSVWAIVCRCLRDSTFSCFGTVSACDGQIHRRTDGQTRDDIKLRASMDGVARQKFSSRRETVRYTSYRIIILVPSISGLEVTLKSVTRGQCNARPTVTFPAA